MGIAEGEVFKKSALQTIETELEQQYTQQGRYDADVTVDTVARPNNRVELKINFNEGTPAKVFDINVIGNTVFKDSEIKQAFAVKESGWASVVTRNDRYAREKWLQALKLYVPCTLTKAILILILIIPNSILVKIKSISLLRLLLMKVANLNLVKLNFR